MLAALNPSLDDAGAAARHAVLLHLQGTCSTAHLPGMLRCSSA